MSYRVKELFATLQGEGARAGRAAVFCRFSGCNLWSGREAHRPTATCSFCDTDFVGTDGPGGGTFAEPDDLAGAVRATWDDHMGPGGEPYVVCTGGEPLLQLDGPLVDALHRHGVEVGIETNGTLPVPPGVDWVCVSPKAGAELVVRTGDELKVVHPQVGLDLDDLLALDFDHHLLQPMDRFERDLNEASAAEAVRYCLEHPGWRLSTQTHKQLGIP